MPAQLRQDALADLARYPYAELRCEPVNAVTAADGGFVVDTAEGQVEALRLVIATGVRDRFPDVERFFEHYGADVFHCPTCDGYEARGKQVVVLGWSEHVAGFALNLLDWAQEITVVTDGRRFEGEEGHRDALDRNGVKLVEEGAGAFVGRRGGLEAVTLHDGTDVPCSLAFFSLGHDPVTELASAIGCALDEQGYIVVDHNQRTTVEGVYAGGDVTPGTQLVQIAAAEGVTAGIACALSLRGESRATLDPGPSVSEELDS